MFHILVSELLNILLQKVEISGVGLQRIPQIILFNVLRGVLQKLCYRLCACLTLQVLSLNYFVKHRLYLVFRVIYPKNLSDLYQH